MIQGQTDPVCGGGTYVLGDEEAHVDEQLAHVHEPVPELGHLLGPDVGVAERGVPGSQTHEASMTVSN
jgi:hypothetical protein